MQEERYEQSEVSYSTRIKDSTKDKYVEKVYPVMLDHVSNIINITLKNCNNSIPLYSTKLDKE